MEVKKMGEEKILDLRTHVGPWLRSLGWMKGTGKKEVIKCQGGE